MTCELETDIAVSARSGFKALEVWAAKMDRFLESHSVADLKNLFAEHKVAPLAISSIEFIAFRGSEYALIQKRLHELGEIADEIGCPTVVLVPSPLPDRNMPWGEVTAEYVRVLRDLSGIASGYGLTLSFEFLGFGWCSVRTPRAAFEIIQEADRDNVGMTVDAAHFHAGGGSMSELARLDPKRIFAFHLDDLEDLPREAVTDAARLLPGEGVVPLDAICAQMKGIGYDGPCSVELFRPEYWQWDPQELAVKAREAALKVLSPYFQIE